MKKMILGAAALAMTFGIGSPAFAVDDPWNGFWNGMNPGPDATVSYLGGSLYGGVSTPDNEYESGSFGGILAGCATVENSAEPECRPEDRGGHPQVDESKVSSDSYLFGCISGNLNDCAPDGVSSASAGIGGTAGGYVEPKADGSTTTVAVATQWATTNATAGNTVSAYMTSGANALYGWNSNQDSKPTDGQPSGSPNGSTVNGMIFDH